MRVRRPLYYFDFSSRTRLNTITRRVIADRRRGMLLYNLGPDAVEGGQTVEEGNAFPPAGVTAFLLGRGLASG